MNEVPRFPSKEQAGGLSQAALSTPSSKPAQPSLSGGPRCLLRAWELPGLLGPCSWSLGFREETQNTSQASTTVYLSAERVQHSTSPRKPGLLGAGWSRHSPRIRACLYGQTNQLGEIFPLLPDKQGQPGTYKPAFSKVQAPLWASQSHQSHHAGGSACTYKLSVHSHHDQN